MSNKPGNRQGSLYHLNSPPKQLFYLLVRSCPRPVGIGRPAAATDFGTSPDTSPPRTSTRL